MWPPLHQEGIRRMLPPKTWQTITMSDDSERKSTIKNSSTAEPPVEDDVAEAVERSYAMRLTSGSDLSEEERRRILERLRSSGGTPLPPVK
jgi:hypothetical protein